jgi:hypothetical protein
MRALVIANCTTQIYVEGLQSLFPDWEVRGVAIDRAEEWLASGDRPEFDAYLRACDLYVGEPSDRWRFGARINPAADKIFIPQIYFRGLHPDVSLLPNFRGPLSVAVPSTQCSLVAVAARALGMNAADAEAMFCADIYREFGFFDLYRAEKQRILDLFSSHDIDLTAEFTNWEEIGAFFHICHHPRAEVLIDILRRALAGRYLDAAGFDASAEIARTQKDYLATMGVWPVYPEIAAALGFQGSMTWIRPIKPPQCISLSDFIAGTFDALDAMGDDWRNHTFVERAASVMKMHLDGVTRSVAEVQSHETGPDPFAELVGEDREAVLAAQQSRYNTAVVHGSLEVLRRNMKLAELDALYDSLPISTRTDAAVMSVWCSVSRIRHDAPEMLRRAQELLHYHPKLVSARANMIYAMHATQGYVETMRQAEIWLSEAPNDHNIISAIAFIAQVSEEWSVAEQFWRLMDKHFRGGLDAGMSRSLVITLRRQGKTTEATQALEEARRKFPDNRILSDL